MVSRVMRARSAAPAVVSGIGLKQVKMTTKEILFHNWLKL